MITREETIFSKVSVTKGVLFDKMIEIIEAAGWTNVSSSPAKDFYVFHSKGSDGRQDLYFQISPKFETADMSTTGARYFGAKPLTEYVPGATGVSGKFTPSNQTFGAFAIGSVDRYPKHPYELYYTADKDRIMFIFEDVYRKGSSFFYVGKPSPTYNKAYANQGLIVFAYNVHDLSCIQMMGEADSRKTVSFAIEAVTSHKEAAFDTSGKLLLHELAFESTSGGFIGYVDGVYTFFNDNRIGTYSMAGDIIDINYKKYRIFFLDAPITSSGWSNWSAKSRFLAVRID